MQTFDVIVIGLGGVGSSALFHLASRGRRVLGLDRFPPLHDRGSSHGTSRIIRQAYFESPVYVPLVLRAYDLWRQLERDSGARLMTITGGVMIGLPDSEVVTGSLASATMHGLPHEVLDASELHRRWPPITPGPGEVGLLEPTAGFVHPEKSITAHRELAVKLGATMHFEESAVSWESNEDRIRVTTSRDRYEAGKLVISPGPWAPELLRDLALPLTVERQVIYWFTPPRPELFHAGRFPIWIWDLPEGLQVYGFPEENGRVKAAFYHAGTPVDPENVDRQVHAEEVERVRRALSTRVPALDAPLAGALTCLYTSTPDHHFIVGLHPHHSNVVVASPCSGHGFKFVPVIGEILADLAIQEGTRHPIAPFSPQRFG